MYRVHIPFFTALRCVCCSISQREYQRREKIALKLFKLKNRVKLDYELGSFYLRHYFFSKIFGRWSSQLQQNLHFNAFRLMLLCPAFVVLEISLLSSIKIIVNTKSIKQRFLIIWTRHKSLDIFTVTRGLSTMTNLKKSYYDT